LTAPILFLFLFAVLEISRYNMIQQTANNAAFEAARICILPGGKATGDPNGQDGQTYGLNVLKEVGISSGSVTIYDGTTNAIITGSIPTTTTSVKATVSVPVSSNLWVTPYYTGNGTVTKSCTLTCDWVNAAS
jgi:Flp pilus assembly protein TadG